MLELTEEQQMIIRTARNFAEKELAPNAARVEEEAIFPRESFFKLGELGMASITVAEKYGGMGLDYLTYILVLEEIAKKCINTAGCLCVHVTVEYIIEKYGSEELKEKYLPRLAQGEIIGGLCLTETSAGSDAASLQSTARLEGDEYAINGTKIFITTGGEAELYIVYAKTDPGKGARGISAFLVEKGNPGLTFGKKENKMAYNGSPTRELIFENCRVPKANLLGQEGMGFKMVMDGLDGGRVAVGTVALGLAEAAFEEAVNYSKTRMQFGQPIASFQGLQFMMADMATEIEAARLLLYEAASQKDSGLPHTKAASMAKMYATDVAMRVTTDAVQIFGGYGYMKDYPVERYMRQAKIFQIVEGTNQIQRVVIARHILA